MVKFCVSIRCFSPTGHYLQNLMLSDILYTAGPASKIADQYIFSVGCSWRMEAPIENTEDGSFVVLEILRCDTNDVVGWTYLKDGLTSRAVSTFGLNTLYFFSGPTPILDEGNIQSSAFPPNLSHMDGAACSARVEIMLLSC